jgi:glycosyltransferase involved in cell wall biosynthesis
MVKVSIIIATYNRSEMIKRNIEAHLRQSYDDYEVIVVDDASSDDTAEFLMELQKKERRIRFFRNNKNLGAAIARNVGIKNARGEMLGFTDDDCYPDKDWIKNALKYFEPEVSSVNGKTIAVGECDKINIHYHDNLAPGDYCTSNIFYRADVLKEIGGFPVEYCASFREDSELAFKLLEKGYKIGWAKDAIVYHITREQDLWKFFLSNNKIENDFILYKNHPKLYSERIAPGWIPIIMDLYTPLFIILSIPAAVVSLKLSAGLLSISILTLLFRSVLTVAHTRTPAKFNARNVVVMFVSHLFRMYYFIRAGIRHRNFILKKIW